MLPETETLPFRRTNELFAIKFRYIFFLFFFFLLPRAFATFMPVVSDALRFENLFFPLFFFFPPPVATSALVATTTANWTFIGLQWASFLPL